VSLFLFILLLYICFINVNLMMRHECNCAVILQVAVRRLSAVRAHYSTGSEAEERAVYKVFHNTFHNK